MQCLGKLVSHHIRTFFTQFFNIFFYSISIIRVEKALALRSAPIALNYERRALLPFLYLCLADHRPISSLLSADQIFSTHSKSSSASLGSSDQQNTPTLQALRQREKKRVKLRDFRQTQLLTFTSSSMLGKIQRDALFQSLHPAKLLLNPTTSKRVVFLIQLTCAAVSFTRAFSSTPFAFNLAGSFFFGTNFR